MSYNIDQMLIITLNSNHIWGFPNIQLVKNPPAMQETLVWFLDLEDPRRRDRLPTPVFLGSPCGSAGKESACKARDLGSKPETLVQSGRPGFNPWFGNPWRRESLPTPAFWPGEFHGLYSPWGGKELDTTEWLFTFTFFPVVYNCYSLNILHFHLYFLSFLTSYFGRYSSVFFTFNLHFKPHLLCDISCYIRSHNN